MYCSKAMFAGHSLMSFSHKPYFIHFCTFIRYYWVILRYINSVGAWNLPLNSAAEICHLSWRTGKSVDGLAKIAFGFVLKTPFLMFFFYLTILIRFGVRSVRNILRQTHGEYGQMAAWFCFIPHSLSDCILSQSHTWCGNWCQPLYWLLFTAVIWIPQVPHNVIHMYIYTVLKQQTQFQKSLQFWQHVSNMNFNVSPECLSFSGTIPKWIIVFEGRRRRPALLSRPFLCNNPRLLGVLDSISLQSFLIINLTICCWHHRLVRSYQLVKALCLIYMVLQ